MAKTKKTEKQQNEKQVEAKVPAKRRVIGYIVYVTCLAGLSLVFMLQMGFIGATDTSTANPQPLTYQETTTDTENINNVLSENTNSGLEQNSIQPDNNANNNDINYNANSVINNDIENNNKTLEEKPDNDIVEENEENNQNTEEKDDVNKNNENLSNSESDDLSENIVQKDFIDNPEKALNEDTNKTENENYTL